MQKQPNSQHCFVCGVSNPIGLQIRFYSMGECEVEARVVFTEFYQGYPGITHGGMVATVLDETMGRAILAIDPQRLMVTANMEIRYRQSVPLHTEILFRGTVTKDRRRIAQATGQAILPDSTVAVEASCTLVGIPADKLTTMNTPEIGWRVYPDE